MIGTAENEIIARLHAVYNTGALGYAPTQIKSFGGSANDPTKDAVKDYPAILVIHERSTRQSGAAGVINYLATFRIVTASLSFRNERASRHGGGGIIGASQMAEDCVSILHDYEPDVADIKRMSAGDIEPFYADESDRNRTSVYGFLLSVPYSFRIQKFELDGGVPLEAIHTNWDLPPLVSTSNPLPDDENADATSHVTGD